MSYLDNALSITAYVPILYFLDIVVLKKYYHSIRIWIWKIFLLRLLIPFGLTFKIYVTSEERPNLECNNLDTFYLNTKNMFVDYRYVFYLIWIIVTLLLLLTYFCLYFKNTFILSQSLPLSKDYNYEMSCSKYKKFPILYSERISSPLTYGIFMPKIVIPKCIIDSGTFSLEYIIHHEYTHIKNHDNFWKILAGIIVCIYWFNPLIWLVYLSFSKKIELSCDEGVLKNLNLVGDRRKSYAENLLQFAVIKSKITLFYNSYSKTQIKERIVEIMKFNEHRTFSILAIFLIFLCGTFIFTIPQIKAEDLKPNQSTSQDTPTVSNKINDIKSDYGITDENLDEKVEALINGELSEDEGNAVIQAFHDRNRKIIAEYEKNNSK